MKNNILTSSKVILLSSLLVGGLAISSTFANEDETSKYERKSLERAEWANKTQEERKQIRLEKQAEKELIKEAILNGDYSKFVELTKDKPISKKVTEENFAEFQEKVKLREEKRGNREEEKELVKEAVKNGDYAKFVELTKDKPIAEKITEENFPKLQELFEAKEKVRALSEELGLEKIKKGKKGGKKNRKNEYNRNN